MNKKIKLLSALLLLLFLFFGAFSNALAIEYGMLGGKPAYPKANEPHGETWFVYGLKPGEALEDGIEIMNLYDESWDALIYAADTTKSSGGGFALKQFSEPKNEVGSWVRFYPNDPPEPFKQILEKKRGAILELCQASREEVANKLKKKELSEEEWGGLVGWCRGEEYIQRKMGPKEKTTIPFVFRVPDDIDVGEHTGGILIQKVSPESQETSQGSAIKLTTRVGVRIYETVPGEIVKKMTLEGFEVKKNFGEFDFRDWFGKDRKKQEYLVQSRVQSESNISLEYHDVIHVKDLIFGQRSQDIDRSFQILRKDKFISNLSWNNPRFGWFSFQTEAKYVDQSGQENVLTSPVVKVLIMPWREMILTLVFFALCYAIYWAWNFYQKKKYGGIGWVSYLPAKDDTLVKLAEKFKVDWKVLARTNRIRAPYILEEGKNILVPPVLGDKNDSSKPGEISVSQTKALENENKAVAVQEVAKEDLVKKENLGEKEIPEEVSQSEKIAEAMAEKSVPSFFDKLKKEQKDPQNAELYADSSVDAKKLDQISRYRRYIVIMGAVVAVLALALAGILIFRRPSKEIKIESQLDIPPVAPGASTVDEDMSPKKEKADIPEASEIKGVADESVWKEMEIKVLNGTKTAGLAGKMKGYLENEGYKKVDMGNTAGENYSGTVVYYGKDKKEPASKLQEALVKQYKNVEIKPALSGNSDTGGAELVIIIGQEK